MMNHGSHKSTSLPQRERPSIIMQFTAPPSLDDVLAIAHMHLETLPEELLEKCHELTLAIDDFPDPATEQDQGINDPYELLALFKAGSQMAPGVTKKSNHNADVLTLYRRPILDMWCESGEDLSQLIRQVMIGELGEAHEFSEADIDEMLTRHYQGLL
jgi:predicted Zn-dependent protease with MMP-like domain